MECFPRWKEFTADRRHSSDSGSKVGNGQLLETVTEVESGARGDRPALARALRRCRLSGATLMVAKLSRLSRDQGFIHGLRDAGVAFVVADMPEANTLTRGVDVRGDRGAAERGGLSRRTGQRVRARDGAPIAWRKSDLPQAR